MGHNRSIMLLILALCLASGFAKENKLYKWIDKDGNVHYSDKPPGSEQSFERHAITTGQALKSVDHKTPYSASSFDQTAFFWVLVKPDLFSQRISELTQVGWYSFGQDCVSPTRMSKSDLLPDSPHQSFLPNESAAAFAMADALKGLGYNARASLQEKIQRDAVNRRPLVLEVELADMDLHACYPFKRKKGNVRSGYDPLSFSAHKFERHKIYVQLSWRLKNYSDQSVIVEGRSEASLNEWQSKSSPRSVVLVGLEKVARQMAADKRLVTSLADLANVRGISNSSDEEESWFSGVKDTLTFATYRKRSKLAKAMSYLSTVKTYTVEFYLTEDRWPTDEPSLDFLHDPKVLANHLIETLHMTSDGHIRVNLDSEAFGNGHYFTLVPEHRDALILWTCQSNLSAAVLQGFNCIP